jgi:hypothetical protein
MVEVGRNQLLSFAEHSFQPSLFGCSSACCFWLNRGWIAESGIFFQPVGWAEASRNAEGVSRDCVAGDGEDETPGGGRVITWSANSWLSKRLGRVERIARESLVLHGGHRFPLVGAAR